VLFNGIQHTLRDLGPGAIVKENKIVAHVQGGKLLPNPINGES
jgi:hypothetical protein